MAVHVDEHDLSSAWVTAFDRLLACDGELVNLVVTVRSPRTTIEVVTDEVADFLASRRRENAGTRNRVELLSSVANTIFPQSLYRQGDRERLYRLEEEAWAVDRRRNPRGTYFRRMVAYPVSTSGADQSVNQLERVVRKLAAIRRRGNRTANMFEVGVVDVSDQDAGDQVAIHSPLKDTSEYGFPCLSHVSFTLADGQLHLTALYRNHGFVRRAYGNYLGLSRLLDFVATEAGWPAGELTCVSTHADAEIHKGRGFGKSALRAFAGRCKALLVEAQAVEEVC